MKAFPRGRDHLVNALMFQAGWFVCVLGGSAWAAIATPLILFAHWCWLARPGEWRWWLGFALLGMAVDGSLIAAGGLVIEHDSPPWSALLPPLWLWALWPLFATTLHHCLAWLWRYRVMAIACGAVGGSLSYVSGAALADVVIAPWAIGVEALVWAMLCGGVATRLGGPKDRDRQREIGAGLPEHRKTQE